ncbi:unnamed protein product [Zymoseptoria tritici ST99CH_1A5]|uniref:Uncharacterized protein n=1 Tax=Zymoseptoria tritici ST99CH_1A5 TaxID=1276529 RepID=A0A1Y6M1L4_ZYMTR|nr:unnamed protein product [Zymoseptoria tritici ST99CH_1A5]
MRLTKAEELREQDRLQLIWFNQDFRRLQEEFHGLEEKRPPDYAKHRLAEDWLVKRLQWAREELGINVTQNEPSPPPPPPPALENDSRQRLACYPLH